MPCVLVTRFNAKRGRRFLRRYDIERLLEVLEWQHQLYVSPRVVFGSANKGEELLICEIIHSKSLLVFLDLFVSLCIIVTIIKLQYIEF